MTTAPSASATEASSPPPVPSPTDSVSPGNSASPTDEASESSSSESSDVDAPDGGDGSDPTDGSTPKPPVLDEQSSGRDLTLVDFFSAPDDWNDGRFTVAGKRDLAGVAGPIQGCYDEASDSSPTVELRLANNFSKISMKIGQEDDSESSDSVVTVKLVGNGKYIDEIRVPFNRISTFTAPVSGVNALKIRIWKGGDTCNSSKGVQVVLTQLRVE